MKHYVTLDKRSKKAQKEYYSKQRRTWGMVNPVTKSVPSGKIYNRNKDKQESRSSIRDFCFLHTSPKCRRTGDLIKSAA